MNQPYFYFLAPHFQNFLSSLPSYAEYMKNNTVFFCQENGYYTLILNNMQKLLRSESFFQAFVGYCIKIYI